MLKKFGRLQRKGFGDGNYEDIEALAFEIRERLRDEVLGKSALWNDLVAPKGGQSLSNSPYGARKNQGTLGGRGRNQDPRTIGLSSDEDTQGLTDIEIIQR